MPRWPAPVRRGRRPGPLFWDIALAVVLAAFSLLTVETERIQNEDVQPHTEHRISPTPILPGEPVEITLHRGGEPVESSNIEPLLTIQNVTTGRWKTYVAKPTSKPGVYRIPAVHPGKGIYSYSVLYGPFGQNVRVRGPSDPPASAVDGTPSEPASSPVWPVGLALLATLPIALRRRYPILVLAITLSAALAMHFVFDNFLLPGAVIALYTVAAHVGRPKSIHLGLATAFVLALPAGKIVADAGLGNLEDSVAAAAVYGVFSAAWLLGDNLRTRRAYLHEVEERAARLEREREANARRAASEEQARIARELHDIIAHNVSVMTVQAAAAGDAFETRPERVRGALASIESTGREALTELRRLLGSVRPDDGVGTFGPQPGLARLEALIEQVRSAGLGVELSVEGSPHELPPGIDLSAYRIVQEALTNTLKHARASKATVLIRYGAGALELDVVDDGRGEAEDGVELGRGIIGMRERAALVGAELRVGPAPGGGFGVHARIPLQGSEA
jgi:signal transduction histidine kinase